MINKFETAPVGAYAGRSLYELPSGEEFTYFKWLEKVYIPTQSEISLFVRFKNVGGIVLLSPGPIDPKRFPNAVLWQEFSNENFKNIEQTITKIEASIKTQENNNIVKLMKEIIPEFKSKNSEFSELDK